MVTKPQEKRCFSACRACYRCEFKESSRCPEPYSCSGHIEMPGGHFWDPRDRDDACRCHEGILQIRLKDKRFVRRKYLSSPFQSEIKTDAESEDDRDWNSYVDEQRELLNDPFFDPLTFGGQGSVTDWMRNARKGRR